MRISVVIPVYNKAPFLERAIDSVLAQTRPADEIIVVDDGSTDDSLRVASQYRLAGVRIVAQANAGPGAARNRGAELATGDLIAFLDADDEWLPEYLFEMARAFEEDPSVAVVSAGYIESPPGFFREQSIRNRGIADGIQEIDASTSPTLLSWRAIFMWTCTTVARLDVYRRWSGFYDADKCRYAEDQVLWLKWMLNERVRFVLKPYAIYHRTASDLNSHRNGPRPLEPFLIHPEILAEACPQRLKPLLDGFLAVRAIRAAMMLGYWGRAREARALLRRFVTLRDLANFTGLASIVACTPFARWFGRPALQLLRMMKGAELAHVQTEPATPRPALAVAVGAGVGAGRATAAVAAAQTAAVGRAAGR